MERSSYGTKYPIVLVHGIAAKKLRILNAFGKIGNKLEEAGNAVFSADTDGFGRIETNAEQLRDYMSACLVRRGRKRLISSPHNVRCISSRAACRPCISSRVSVHPPAA